MGEFNNLLSRKNSPRVFQILSTIWSGGPRVHEEQLLMADASCKAATPDNARLINPVTIQQIRECMNYLSKED